MTMSHEIDLAGCEAIGVGGYHSEHYCDPDDGVCQWCGLRRTPAEPQERPMKPVVIYQGAVKLAEEAAELGVELAKLQAFPEGEHPDGRGVCIDRVVEEMADVIAAIQWFCARHARKVDWTRVDAKVARFAEWDRGGQLAGAVVWREDE